MTTILLIWYALGWSAVAATALIDGVISVHIIIFLFVIGWLIVPFLPLVFAGEFLERILKKDKILWSKKQ